MLWSWVFSVFGDMLRLVVILGRGVLVVRVWRMICLCDDRCGCVVNDGRVECVGSGELWMGVRLVCMVVKFFVLSSVRGVWSLWLESWVVRVLVVCCVVVVEMWCSVVFCMVVVLVCLWEVDGLGCVCDSSWMVLGVWLFRRVICVCFRRVLN